MALHLTHRPNTLEDFIGNASMIGALESVLSREGEIPHAFLFTGPSGCGKTTLARIVATRLGCSEYDFKELNAADFRGIDTIREVRKQVSLRPLGGKCRVWILDECHSLSGDAQNALLKLLEDTPKHVYFMLCTTNPQKLIKTIISRCMEFQVGTLPENRIVRMLEGVVEKEGKTIPKQVLEHIAVICQGHPRRALVALDKVIDLPEEKMMRAVEQSQEEESQVIDLCRALMERKKWVEIAKILKGLKDQEPEQVRRAVLGYCNSVLLNKESPQAYLVMERFMRPLYDTGFPGLTLACYEALDAVGTSGT